MEEIRMDIDHDQGQKKELYIPVNTPDSDDYISGIGRKEISLIMGMLLIVIILAVIIFSRTGNSIYSVLVAAILMSIGIMLVRRDQYNETVIKKIKIILDFRKSQKYYRYQYKNIYEGGDRTWL